MLPLIASADRALVWSLVGGVPLYLQWWDQIATIEDNLQRLVCTPGGRLLTEGEYVLATEAQSSDLARQVLYALAAGRTRFNEIRDAVHTNPARVLEDLIRLRLVERITPVTEDPRHNRRSLYRIADNFLAFWLGIVDRYRTEIDRGLGHTILPVLRADLDDFCGHRWEAAYHEHLRRMATLGRLPPDVVAIGPYWSHTGDPVEIDVVALAGRDRHPVLVGEAKWARQVDGQRIRRELERRAQTLPGVGDDLVYSICAREQVSGAEGVLAVTAADIFG